MRAREINREIERRGGTMVRQVGSHRRYVARDGELVRYTTVAQHPGDVPIGTLARIERDLEPVFGEGWLRR